VLPDFLYLTDTNVAIAFADNLESNCAREVRWWNAPSLGVTDNGNRCWEWIEDLIFNQKCNSKPLLSAINIVGLGVKLGVLGGEKIKNDE